MNITVISGPPASGKTSFSRLLSSRDSRGVHVETDSFFRFFSHRIDPSSAVAREQNEVAVRAYVAAAAAYASNGYNVYLDGVIGPWMFPLITPTFPRFDFVLLQTSLQQALSRTEARGSQQSAEPQIVARMHAQFASVLDDFRRHVVDTEGKSVQEGVDEFVARRPDGAFICQGA